MVVAVVQSMLAAVACAFLFSAFRRLSGGRVVAAVIAAGFLIRALSGQAAFWISYLHLPIARGLQRTGGYWFYGSDGERYMERAVADYRGGLESILTLDTTIVSPVFVKVLTIGVALFGPVPSIAILLNLAAFLAICAVIVSIAPRPSRSSLAAIAAISLSPALILWSTQPLKDVFFGALLAAFIGAIAWSMRAVERRESGWSLIWPALAVIAVLSAVGGVRWYIVLVLLGAALIPVCAVVMRSRAPIATMAGVAVTYSVVLLLTVGAAGPFIPAALKRLAISPTVSRVATAPRIPVQLLVGARNLFEQLPGGTTVRAGRAVARLPPPVARAVTGTAALLLPLEVGRAAGLLEVGGGRGLWSFTLADTLVFDAVLLIALVATIRALRGRHARGPLLWTVLTATILISAALAYSVTNYGALVRYRSMVFVGLVMLIAAAAPMQRAEEAVEESPSSR